MIYVMWCVIWQDDLHETVGHHVCHHVSTWVFWVHWYFPTVQKPAQWGWLGTLKWHHIFVCCEHSITEIINGDTGLRVKTYQVIAVFPFCLMWFSYFPICLESCLHSIINSAMSGCLMSQRSISSILKHETFSPSPPVFFFFFFKSTNCFLNVPFALPCHLLAPLLVFSHPLFSSHLYESMSVSRCAR